MYLSGQYFSIYGKEKYCTHTFTNGFLDFSRNTYY